MDALQLLDVATFSLTVFPSLFGWQTPLMWAWKITTEIFYAHNVEGTRMCQKNMCI